MSNVTSTYHGTTDYATYGGMAGTDNTVDSTRTEIPEKPNEPPSKEETEEEKTWRELLYEYSQNTTFHGVKFITSTSRYPVRKILWLCIIGAAMTVFVALFIQRLVHYFHYPRAVNMELTYKSDLPFPAVTICNQNQFRLTKIQQLGLYDTLTERLGHTHGGRSYREKRELHTEVCKDFYKIPEEPYTCINPNYRQVNSFTYNEVTLNGCKHLCTSLHDLRCSTILFMPTRRSCLLLPRINITKISGDKDCAFAEIYQRERCLSAKSGDLRCDFEERDCPLMPDKRNTEDWKRIEAYLDDGYSIDHTTLSEAGHMNYLTERSRSVESTARLMTKFVRTDGYCLRLFVWPRGDSAFRVYVKGEDFIDHKYAEEIPDKGPGSKWQMIFIRLPKGINQIIFEGYVNKDVISGILMDDLIISSCSEFDDATCRQSVDGVDYLGGLSMSASGKQCQPWRAEQKVQMNKYGQGTTKACRWLQQYSGLMCHVGGGLLEECRIKFCECPADSRPCDNGFCIPSNLFCDGIPHCPDGSDELNACDYLRNVDCNFKTDFRCGYNSLISRSHLAVFWKRMDATFEDLFNNSGSYMLVESSYSLAGSRGHIGSPKTTLTEESCLCFDYILNHTDTLMQASLAVFVQGEVIGRRLWVSKTIGKQIAKVNVPANLNDVSFRFTATVADPSTTKISFTNVKLLDESCKVNTTTECDFSCDDGNCINKTAMCDGVSDCMDETDEQYKLCSDLRISASCDFDNEYLCGYKRGSNFQYIAWIKEEMFDIREVASSDCGGDFTKPNGKITSPGFPKNYNNRANCIYNITTEPGKQIEITFEAFNLENATSCVYDSLRIYDSDGVTPLTGRLCGAKIPKSFLSPNSSVILKFRSDGSVTASGFCAKYITPGLDNTGQAERYDGILATKFTGEVPFTPAYAYLISPKVTTKSTICLTFRYFNQGKMELMLSTGINSMDEILVVNVDGGRSWHSGFVNLSPGAYYLQFRSYGTDKELPVDGSPEDIYLAAINDIVLHDTTCSNVMGANSSMTCDFQPENVCGYNVNLLKSVWARVKRKKAYYLAANLLLYMPQMSRITSPYTLIKNDSCVTITVIVMTSKRSRSRVEERLPTEVARYDAYFFTRRNQIKHKANVYVEHATASYAVISFSGVDLDENGEDLRMEIDVLTDCLFYLDRVEVMSNCSFQENASRRLQASEDFSDEYTTGVYKETNLPQVPLPDGFYVPGLIFSDESTHPREFIPEIHFPGSGLIPPLFPPGPFPPGFGSGSGLYSPDDDNTTSDNETTLALALDTSTDDTEDETIVYTEEIMLSTDETELSTEATFMSTAAPMVVRRKRNVVKEPTSNQAAEPTPGDRIDNSTGSDKSGKPAYGEEVIDDMGPFYTDTGHQLFDLIYRCSWDKEPCNKVGFHSHATDLGLCHTFNADPEMKLNVSKTGSGFGLSLIVNLEQYEYIESDNTDAGIKVYLYDQDDIPMIKDLGFAVSPGVHALVASFYSTAKGLKEPYGTCDEAPLPFYKQDTTYTHARCKQQCNSNYTMLNCSCKDAYMPGNAPVCNFTEYLDCILPIKEQSGFAHANCSCPDACNMKNYGVELSYSSLSSLGVTSLLGYDVKNILTSYRNALEISHRVRVHQLEMTVEMLSNISLSLQRFVWVMESMGRFALRRANDALHALEMEVEADFSRLNEVLKQHFRNNYYKFQGQNISLALALYDKATYTIQLAYISGRTYLHTTAELNYMREAFSWLMNHTKVSPPSELRDFVPEYLWKPGDRMDECMELFVTQHELLQSMLTQFTSTNAKKFLHSSIDVKECLLEYEGDLKGVMEHVETIRRSCADVLLKEDVLTFEELQVVMENELVVIKENLTNFENLARKYAENKITKLQLAEEINKNVLKEMDNYIERLVYYLELYTIGPLKTETSNLIGGIPYWYHSVLNEFHELSKYFERNTLTYLARNMKIWRIPVARMETTNVLEYQHSFGQTWRTWPSSYTLEHVVETGHDIAVISTAIHNYITVVNELLYDFEDDIFTARTEVLNSMAFAADTLEEYKKTAQISADFVLNNFLMMDVYFPALKYEAWEQIEAYGVQNFLSETGGYMGLLIGASALTLCEILDLIIYNLIIRCTAKRHSKMAVAPASRGTIRKM